ncbi:hypothetical protein PRIPAC_84674 [Pristionchus pacificus]|uniref:Uncharacterized protein n=1 Tax=Pristionchus pacificus TaxID=54126 RepID=A0A2A6BTG3_PRIPA|nr:hypothetical protein PRIPAC_84674 [Pristionchus pacificus]|eukprot:PDM69103.1 hypothetical protein PRIPAC_47405 [Pristionchus pacificus]
MPFTYHIALVRGGSRGEASILALLFPSDHERARLLFLCRSLLGTEIIHPQKTRRRRASDFIALSNGRIHRWDGLL